MRNAAPSPAPIPPNIVVDAGDPTPAIEQLAAVVGTLMARMVDMEARHAKRNEALLAKIAALSVEVNTGETNVHIPDRARRFEIEYDNKGQPVALVPEYAVTH